MLNTGLAYTVHCLRCAAQRFVEDNDCDSAPSLQDAELRILLLQDTKNRELLLQLWVKKLGVPKVAHADIFILWLFKTTWKNE